MTVPLGTSLCVFPTKKCKRHVPNRRPIHGTWITLINAYLNDIDKCLYLKNLVVDELTTEKAFLVLVGGADCAVVTSSPIKGPCCPFVCGGVLDD
jgi:hypothetical protein